MNPESESTTIEINEWIHVAKARRQAVKMAGALGFSEQALGQIAIVVSELAENLVAHQTVQGCILLSVVVEGARRGLQVVSEDRGPGIANVELALRDGQSERASLGIGLGAVKRLMDEFDISSKTQPTHLAFYKNSREGIGTVIVARKWLPPASEAPSAHTAPEIRFGIMSRPKSGETVNGDQCFLHYTDEAVTVAVIDGLGHGHDAHLASHAAYLVLLDEGHRPLDDILSCIHMRLRNTRGAALALARITHRAGTLDYVGVGNILTRVYQSPAPVHPVNRNGIVGSNLPVLRVYQYPWHPKNILIMSSDGISDKYNPEVYPDLLSKHPTVIADVLLRDYGRDHDDATVAVGAHL